MAPPQKSPASTVQGFGKVLTSIQGLQKRLEDFSVEEVSRAENDAKSLIQQISVLRTKLQHLAELKSFVVSANSLISAIPSENFDQVAPDGLENHPQLHAIVQASKLIRLHRIMQAAKAGAEAFSLDAEAGVLSFATATPHEPVTAAEGTLPSSPALDAAHLSAPPFEVPSEPATAAAGSVENEAPHAVEEQEWIFSPEPEESHAAVTEHVFDVAAAGSQLSETSDPVEKPQSSTLAEKHETQAIQAIESPKPGIHFDQRLLSDLIETYGEFTEAARLPATIEVPHVAQSESVDFQLLPDPVQTPKQTKVRSPKPQASPTPATGTLKSESRQTLPATITASEPKESRPPELRTIPTPKASETKPLENEQRTPAIRRHGELDRQLKSIIKDYGEYDLYSHRSTINFKTAAIAAFAVLGLLLGGLYFFKVPAVRTPAAVTAGQPAGLPNAAKSAAGSRATDTSNSDKSK